MDDNRLELRVRKMFINENLDFTEIGKEFQGLAKYFKETRPGKINNYDNGVRSVVIEGLDKEIPSTFGYLPKGKFKFNTGSNQETMHFLFGSLSWGVEGNKIIVPNQYDKLIVPAGKNLILNVKNPSLYICDYSKQ